MTATMMPSHSRPDPLDLVALENPIFCDADHQYWAHDVTGLLRRYVGVTEVLTLAGYKNPHVEGHEDRAELGSQIHAWLASMDRRNPRVAVSTSDQGYGYVQSYIGFLEQYDPEWRLIERMVWDDALELAGRVDRVGRLRRGVPITTQEFVVDIKTGSPDPMHGPQTALYERMVHPREYRLRAVLLLSPTGAPGVLRRQTNRDDYAAGLAAVESFRWRRAHARLGAETGW